MQPMYHEPMNGNFMTRLRGSRLPIPFEGPNPGYGGKQPRAPLPVVPMQPMPFEGPGVPFGPGPIGKPGQPPFPNRMPGNILAVLQALRRARYPGFGMPQGQLY